MIITIHHDGFHGRATVRVRGEVVTDARGGERVYISEATARRIDDAVCGVSDCTCGEGISSSDGDVWRGDARYFVECDDLSGGEVDIDGRYPQSRGKNK
jgi:hypothetical protein